VAKNSFRHSQMGISQRGINLVLWKKDQQGKLLLVGSMI